MKLLNGFVYWPDIIQVGLLAAILAAVIAYRREPVKQDEEVIKQEIMDKLDKIIKDIRSTV